MFFLTLTAPVTSFQQQHKATPVELKSAAAVVRSLQYTPKPTPNYTTEVLDPLRAAQAAKAEQDRLAALQAAIVVPTAPPVVYAPISGSHTDWMAQAGIDPSNFGYVDWIITRESGWRVTVQNAEGAYGLPQALPGYKMASAGADWATNPITQLRWMQSYAVGRYGSWAGAQAFWQSHSWY